jgi:hypothetical protein
MLFIALGFAVPPHHNNLLFLGPGMVSACWVYPIGVHVALSDRVACCGGCVSRVGRVVLHVLCTVLSVSVCHVGCVGRRFALLGCLAKAVSTCVPWRVRKPRVTYCVAFPTMTTGRFLWGAYSGEGGIEGGGKGGGCTAGCTAD